MNFLDTIGNLLDLSKKQQNFPKDIENLQKILETIQEGLRQVDQNDLPLHIADLLSSHLKATEELLQNLSQRHHSWWAVVQKLVPGTDIWKLKVNYDEFLHIDKVLNLYLTKGKKSKRSALSCLPLPSEVMYGSVSTKRLRTVSDRGIDVNLLDVPLRKSATSLNLNSSYRHSFPPSRMNSLNRTTSTTLGLSSIKEEPENRGKLAFKLKLLYEDKLDGFIRQYRIVPKVIEEYWNGGDHKEFIFRREEFNYLPIKESTKLSRDHAALIVTRQPKKKIIKGETESSNVMIEEEPNKSTTSSQEDDEYEYKFVLRDLSLNGTYYLKGAQPEDNNVHAAKVIGEFAPLTKNTEVELTHGDIVGLIMQKPACNELTFGFQLFTH